jgi:hypothetical protein
VTEIRICFIGLSKLLTKDNSFMLYRILVKYVTVCRNLNEICDYLLEFELI